MIVYFTGTGNSRFAAECLAAQLQDELVDAREYIRSGKTANLESEKSWIFVSPTYAWRIPSVFQRFIENSSFSGSRQAYFVMTCGDSIGNAEAYVRKLCAKKAFEFRGLVKVRMPENYIAMFNAPSKELAKAIIMRSERLLVKEAARMRNGERLPDQKVRLGDRILSGPVNPVFYACCVKARLFYATDACIGCGKCADMCMLNNIRIEGKRPVWGRDCTHCMACICHCPAEAIEYGKKSQGKWRYRAPVYPDKNV